MSARYDHKAIEKKWQKKWEESQLYKTAPDSSKPKSYVLDMFPYPSGEGLHVGHPKGYIATDVYSRFQRMQGKNVLHPMGWDAFGLPAENYALKNKVHPRVAVEKNIATFKSQLSHIGFDYDWSREINTTDPEYYKWTQWIFLQLFKKGLAYQSDEPINWCPSCMTGLANEDLDGTVCERCGTVVEKKSLPQWVLKITAYADRMLADLDSLNWPEHIKEAQRNWIGRSEGAEINFALICGSQTSAEIITVFTTRPDTLFGATFLVLAPEHPLVATLDLENRTEVGAYVKEALAKTEIDRTKGSQDKTGVELKGVKAINPGSKEEIPIFVADYVLGGYGTGAIMAVPAHDERDYEFAKKFELPIREVIVPDRIDPNNPPRDGKRDVPRRTVQVVLRRPSDGKIVVLHWSHASWKTLLIGGVEEGEKVLEAAKREVLEETGYKNIKFIKELGDMYAGYFASHKDENRRAYATGLLFELIDEQKDEVSAEEKAKHEPIWMTVDEAKKIVIGVEPPIFLTRLEQDSWIYEGEGTLVHSGTFDGLSNEDAKKKITEYVGGKATTTYKIKDWVFSRQRYWGEPIPVIHCPTDGAVAVPEDQLPVLLPEVASYEPSGTVESPLATIAEWVNTTCPTCGGPAKRETNTMPQWAGSSWYYLRFMDPNNTAAPVGKDTEKYWAPVDVYVGGDHAVRHLIYARFWHKFLYDIGSVTTTEPFKRLEFLGFILAEDGRKMSKRYGNVINPDDVVATYGADAFRTYEMFMGPFENTVAWSTASIAGTTRFIERVWKMGEGVQKESVPALDALLHQTIKKVSQDIEAFKFNTAVSQMMILLNAIEKEKTIGAAEWQIFLQLLAPFAPHVTEELWEKAGYEGSIHTSAWPQADESKITSAIATIAVQVNGKTRATIELPAEAGEEEALAAARAEALVAKWLALGKEVKAVYVPGKVISFVTQQPA